MSLVGPPPVPDGSGTTEPMRAARGNQDGSEVVITWDTQCEGENTNVLFGPLDQVAVPALSGSVCSVSSPATWNAVPIDDLWFVLVNDDGNGTESSWGLATSGERNAEFSSGECGNFAKAVNAACP